MSIRLAIKGAKIKPDYQNQVSDGEKGGWWVGHPRNDAILAYCDTKEEAEVVVRWLTAGPFEPERPLRVHGDEA